jgi:hypothetical protein
MFFKISNDVMLRYENDYFSIRTCDLSFDSNLPLDNLIRGITLEKTTIQGILEAESLKQLVDQLTVGHLIPGSIAKAEFHYTNSIKLVLSLHQDILEQLFLRMQFVYRHLPEATDNFWEDMSHMWGGGMVILSSNEAISILFILKTVI